MATITPANLAYKDKDGDLGEVKSLTDTDVTLLNTALQDIEDLKLAYSPGFAKRDFSNVTAPTQAFKDMSVGWGAVDTSAPVSISSGYITPSDGYVVTNVSAYGAIGIVINGVIMTALDGKGITIDGTLSCRVGKGDTVTLMSYGGSSSNFRFFPCKGAN